MKLGLYGGTFDPPHIGHLIVAQDAYSALGLDRVLLIPAGTPPHKQDRIITPAETRLRMLELAIAGDARFAIEDVELGRSGPTYSVDTMAEIRSRHPHDDLYLLIGADQFREFRTWRDPERIASLVKVVVLSRAGVAEVSPADVEAFGAQWVNVTPIDLSSSVIRRRIRAGESVRYLVPPGVEAFLDEHRIYDE